MPLVEVSRSGVVECMHRGSFVIVTDHAVTDLLGNAAAVTPMRSTAKPFQEAALLRRGGQSAFNLTDEEIAVMASSHNGEMRHVEVVEGLLRKVALDKSSLLCGEHPPYFPSLIETIFRETGSISSVLHNNCSGKHAGMLLLASLQGSSSSKYACRDHPVQVEILERVSESLGLSPENMSLGVDGCGVPTYNVRLDQLAKAYALLAKATATGEPRDLAVVGRSWLTAPFMVAGTARLDTDLMSMDVGILGKVGSEGIYCLGVPSAGLGVAIKIESGSEAAAECTAVELLVRLGLLKDQEASRLDIYWRRPVRTFTDQIVGEYRACF